MNISRFVILFTAVFFLELIFLGIFTYPTFPLVALYALSALASISLPWYLYFYMLVVVCLSAFLQNFSISFSALNFCVLTLLSITFRGMLEHTLVVQSALAVFFGFVFIWFNCIDCLTIRNIFITILIVPFMIKSLQ